MAEFGSTWNYDVSEKFVNAIIPIIQKDLIERMMEPSEGMSEAAYGDWTPSCHPEADDYWDRMLRAFAKENGIEIE